MTLKPIHFDQQPLTKRIRWDDWLLALLVVGTLVLLAMGGCATSRTANAIRQLQIATMNATSQANAENSQTAQRAIPTLVASVAMGRAQAQPAASGIFLRLTNSFSPGAVVYLQSCTNLARAVWSTMATNTTLGTNQWFQVTAPAGAQTFWRFKSN